MRVAELGTGAAVPFAGRMFVNFGAEVVKLEIGPDGDWTRTKPPMVGPSEARFGALFHYLNAGKRSVMVGGDGADLDRTLDCIWGWADAVLIDEEFLGLDAVTDRLRLPGPKAATCVTPFGPTGPDGNGAGTSLTMFARCGEASITPGGLGYKLFPDAAPLVARGKVAEIDAGIMAALVTMATLTGEGAPGEQPVLHEVSVQETQVSNNRWIPSNFEHSGWIESRATSAYAYGGLLPCSDGYVMFLPSTNAHWGAFVAMMGSPAWATSEEFATYAGRAHAGERVRAGISEWAATKSKAELFKLGLDYGVPIGPFRTVEEVTDCPQLNARGFFVPYGEPGSDTWIPGLPSDSAMSEVRVPYAPALNSDADYSFLPATGERGSAR